MDLNDAERYAVAALFTLALHSTHVSAVPATVLSSADRTETDHSTNHWHPLCHTTAMQRHKWLHQELTLTQARRKSCADKPKNALLWSSP
jgi:hypothetical protein